MEVAHYRQTELQMAAEKSEEDLRFWDVDQGVLIFRFSKSFSQVLEMTYSLSDERPKALRKTFQFRVSSFDPVTGRMTVETAPAKLTDAASQPSTFNVQPSTPSASVSQPSTNNPQPPFPNPQPSSLVWIPPGEFLMGSPTEETGRELDEGPQTRVKFPHGFWMGKFEVSQAEYQRLIGTNPSNATGDSARPVERVNWFEAMEYCKRLTKQEENVGRLPNSYAYRLPTEAEWEYACRAGTTSRFSYGDDENGTHLIDYAWFTRNSESITHPVGGKQPNPWGLYDMHGNVWEWCLDRWADALPGGTITNAPTSTTGTLRVARGGSWLYEPKACRSANRDDYSPWDRCSDIGFRIVLAPYER